MNPHAITRIALPLMFVAMTAGSAAAQQKPATHPTDDKVAETLASNGADMMALGYRLADYARATQDPRAMIVAARIVDRVTVSEGTDKGKLESIGKGGGETTGTAKALTASDLFGEAKQLANGDPDLLAQIEASQAEASRGVACCTGIRTVQFVPASTTWTVRFFARGGEAFVVGARRDTAVRVVLRVFDENGGLMCEDRSGNVTLYCRSKLPWSGPVAIQLINFGDKGTGLALVAS